MLIKGYRKGKMWSFYSEVTYKRVILNKAISEVQSTRQHIREWGTINKATYMRVIVDKAISEVQLTRHLKDAHAIVGWFSLKSTSLARVHDQNKNTISQWY